MSKLITLNKPWRSYSTAMRYFMIARYDAIEFMDKSIAHYEREKNKWFIYHPTPSYRETCAYDFCMMTRASPLTWTPYA